MRSWLFILAVAAACAACDDNLYLNPVPHDAGTDSATPSDGGDAGHDSGGPSDAGGD